MIPIFLRFLVVWVLVTDSLPLDCPEVQEHLQHLRHLLVQDCPDLRQGHKTEIPEDDPSGSHPGRGKGLARRRYRLVRHFPPGLQHFRWILESRTWVVDRKQKGRQ